MNRVRSGGIACLLFASWLCGACGPNRPEVLVTIVPGRDGDPLANLTKVRMIVRACESELPAFAGDLAFPSAPGQAVSPLEEVGIPPGQLFYVWLQGWEACEEEDLCTPEDVAQAGDCICATGMSPSRQRLTREGCSEWLRLEEGETLPLTLTLGPAAGLCPPPALACS